MQRKPGHIAHLIAEGRIAGRLANRNRNGYGKLNTHWRTGFSGKTASTSNAALSAK